MEDRCYSHYQFEAADVPAFLARLKAIEEELHQKIELHDIRVDGVSRPISEYLGTPVKPSRRET